MNDACRAQMAEVTDAIGNYLVAILEDGDYLNDWLSHVPECGQTALVGIGQLLALLIGS
jgi:hypothetical protein